MAKEYFRRIAVCFVGLIFYGLGNACGVMAGSVGTNAWNTLSIGLADSLGWSFGAANFCISLIVIVAVIIGKGKIGIGTILNIVVISLFSELWIGLLRLLPASDSRILGVGYSLLIELAQIPFFDRVSDIDDLILNSLGFLLGYGIYLLVKVTKRIQKRRRGRK